MHCYLLGLQKAEFYGGKKKSLNSLSSAKLWDTTLLYRFKKHRDQIPNFAKV